MIPRKHLKPADYREMRWQNGGGTTREVYASPADSGAQTPFFWRFSLARVETAGPFSPFVGKDRTIVQLSAAELRLDHGRHGSHDLQRFVPYQFDGGWPTSATLKGDAAADANLICHRAAYRSLTTMIAVSAASSWSVTCHGELLLYIPADQASALTVQLTASTTETLRLGPDETLVVTGPCQVAVQGAAQTPVWALVAFLAKV